MDHVAVKLAEKGVTQATADGKYYSVAFEMKLSPTSYPGFRRSAHFKEANAALDAAMKNDANFASMMRGLGVSIPKSNTGRLLGESPANFTWHHGTQTGIMQLVPRTQHNPGSIFQKVLHPGGVGGQAIWGK